ncbi:MAG: CerR family C-terminal domain-containing protein [Tsuneonella sp.]
MVQNRLLDIAVREFGASGLEGASTRGIAAAAGTAMSSITYHFGGKEGLYLAAAEHIAQQMGQVTDELPPVDESDPAAAREQVKLMLARLVDKVARSENQALFIVREQMNPTEGFERLWRGPMGRMWQRMAQLICIATGHSDQRACRIVAMTLFSQAIAIRAARASFERLLECGLDDQDLLDEVKATILANADAILDRLAQSKEQPR